MVDSNCLPDFNDLCSKQDCAEIKNFLQQINAKLDRQALIEFCNFDPLLQLNNEIYSELLGQRIILQQMEQQLLRLLNKDTNIDLSQVLSLLNQILNNVVLPNNNFVNYIKCLEEETEEGDKWELKETLQATTLGEYLQLMADQNEQLWQSLCELEIESEGENCSVLVDNNTVSLSYGYYLILYWKWTDKTITSNAGYWTVRNPIPELINPTNPETIWNTYFNGISYTVGEVKRVDYSINSEGITIKHPLLNGYFSDDTEGDRIFNLLRPLSTETRKPTNNPFTPLYGNPQTHIKHSEKVKILRKVCVVQKSQNSNETITVNVYVP